MNAHVATVYSLEQLQHYVDSGLFPKDNIAALLECFRSEDEELRSWAADTALLAESLPRNCIDTLLQYRTENNVIVAAWTCKLCGLTDRTNEQLQAMLTDYLDDSENIGVRQEAAKALEGWTPLDRNTIAALRLAAQAEDARLNRYANAALQSATI